MLTLHRSLGRCYEELGQYQNAIDHFEAVRSLLVNYDSLGDLSDHQAVQHKLGVLYGINKVCIGFCVFDTC